MNLTKLTGTINFQSSSAVTELRKEIFTELIKEFNKIGLIGNIKEESILFEKAPEKPDDYGRGWRFRSMFSVIRSAGARIINTGSGETALEISIDVSYSIFLAVALSACFCMGFIFLITEIGVLTYIAVALSVMALTMAVSLIYIVVVLEGILDKIADAGVV